jgi:hypothetical protein
MAKGRSWDSLSPTYRERLSRAGVTKSQYQSGTNLSKARGHAQTPEHPREAERHPERYPDYVARKARKRPPGGAPPKGPAPEDEAYELNENRDYAFLNIYGKLGHYHKFNRKTVLANVYGGETAESGEVKGMTLEQAQWSANADTEELRSAASDQYRANPWFYH